MTPESVPSLMTLKRGSSSSKKKIRELIMPPLNARFNGILEKLWGMIGKLKNQISSALVTAVGSVPFVGGMLAATIPPAIDKAFTAIKDAVNNVLSNIIDNIINSIVGPIVDKITNFLNT